MPRAKSRVTMSLATAFVAVVAPLAVGVAGTGGLTGTASAAPSYLVGASTPAASLGPLPVQRVFRNSIGRPISSKAIVSFRQWDEGAVRQFVRGSARGTVISFMHEPEQEVASHKISAATWAARNTALTQIIKQEGRVGQVVPATILMAWTLDKGSGRAQMLNQLLSPGLLSALRSTGGVLCWDAYSGQKNGRTPEAMYGPEARFAASVHLPWGITETGAVDPDARRWQETFNYLDRMPNPPRYFLAWNPVHLNGGRYAIQNQPAVAAVWRAEMRQHGH